MTSYRRMRRQAGRIHRSGVQPMMLISSGDQFPEPVGLVILRLAWRYRSELAPAYLASVIVGSREHASGVRNGRWRGPPEQSTMVRVIDVTGTRGDVGTTEFAGRLTGKAARALSGSSAGDRS